MGERRHGEYWEGCWARYGVRLSLLSLLKVKGESEESSKVKGQRSKVEAQRSKLKGERGEGAGSVGNGLTLKVLRKHIKRLVNYAEAGDGEKIREELKRIEPVMSFQLSVISSSILIFMFLHLGI